MRDMPAGQREPGSDPRWPKLLSLTVHEFRSPLTVVSGYIRMLLTERAGPVPEQQRRLLEEADKSCARLSQLLGEVSDLSHLEEGTVAFNRGAVDVRGLLTGIIASLPELRDRSVRVELDADGEARVHADATRLKQALTAVISALRRELVTSDALKVRVETVDVDGRPTVRITVGEADRMAHLRSRTPQQLGRFDEWRGGNGLSLVNARRIIDAHGGALLAPLEDERTAAVVCLPAL